MIKDTCCYVLFFWWKKKKNTQNACFQWVHCNILIFTWLFSLNMWNTLSDPRIWIYKRIHIYINSRIWIYYILLCKNVNFLDVFTMHCTKWSFSPLYFPQNWIYIYMILNTYAYFIDVMRSTYKRQVVEDCTDTTVFWHFKLNSKS